MRRRWRSLVVLGVLAGVTAGLSMTAFAGARRTDAALARLRAATNAPDAIVFSSQVGAYHPDWSRLRARAEVRSVAVWDLVFGAINGEGGLLFASHDGEFFGKVGHPIVVEGRMYDPKAPDEVVVAEAETDEAPVGSTVTFQPFAANQSDLAGDPPAGPKVTLKVVGAIRTVQQFLFTDMVVLSPGFLARYGDQVEAIENADVLLAGGANDIPTLQRDVNEVVAPGTPVLDLHAVSRRVDTTLAVEHGALMLLGVVLALAGGLLVAQALIRSAGTVGDDGGVLRGIGMTRRDLTRAAALAHLPTVAVTMVVATATAILASPAFPLGLGRRIDIDVGIHADWVVIGPGTALTSALVAVAIMAVAWRVVRSGRPVASARPSAFVSSLRRRAPVVLGLGASMALEKGRGRSSVAVQPALIGAMVGVLGVVSTMTIDRGIHDSLAHPERAGVTWDAVVGFDLGAYQAGGLRDDVVDGVLAAAPRGSSAVVVDRQVLPVNGVGVPTFALRGSRGDDPVALSITKGRAPRAVGEAAIGRETARVLGVGLGDTATFDGGHAVRLVGFGFFPSDVHAEFDEGFWVTPEQMELIEPSPSEGVDYAGDRTLALRFPPGTDAASEVGRLGEKLTSPVAGVVPAEVPAELENLRNVRTLPVLLAGFLALLAIGVVGHVLLTSAIRRRRDFAVLRALGLNRRGARLVLSAQGTAIALVGLVVGVPLGIAGGRVGWHWVAQRVPLEDVPPFALIAVLLVVPLAVVIANGLAVWPGHRASRIRPAEVLRAE